MIDKGLVIMVALLIILAAVAIAFSAAWLIVQLYGVNGWLGTAALLLFAAGACYVLNSLLAAAELTGAFREDDDADQIGGN